MYVRACLYVRFTATGTYRQTDKSTQQTRNTIYMILIKNYLACNGHTCISAPGYVHAQLMMIYYPFISFKIMVGLLDIF